MIWHWYHCYRVMKAFLNRFCKLDWQSYTHVFKKNGFKLVFSKKLEMKETKMRWGELFNNPHRTCGVFYNLLHCFPMKLLKKSRAPHDGVYSRLKIKWPSNGIKSSHTIKHYVCVSLAAVLLDNVKHVFWYFLVLKWVNKQVYEKNKALILRKQF